ncbi:hypothetical protein ABIQ69_15635 [Agromyces sp. G08B096]|uniref:Secreted protein n=1 Tax=Agromyces sp. G08B096 TaxID=3156399 RepID=A0AAU7W8I9_9MICO
MQRIMTSTALVFAGALLLAGCASNSGDGGSTAAAGDCETIRVEVRNISNGAQNTLASTNDPAEIESYLEELSERVDALSEDATDEKVSDALEALDERIDAAADFAATLPADPEAERDADAIAEQQSGIQEASVKVTEVCTAE